MCQCCEISLTHKQFSSFSSYLLFILTYTIHGFQQICSLESNGHCKVTETQNEEFLEN